MRATGAHTVISRQPRKSPNELEKESKEKALKELDRMLGDAMRPS